MRIDTIPMSHANSLANDYIHAESAVSKRYDGHPNDESSWTSRLAYLKHKPLEADRDRLVSALKEYNRKVGNHEQAIAHIEALRSPDTLVVIGGQQAGLFGGPLLVIYKAITVIRQAREAGARYGRPVVPVFWIAGEDHDFAEVDHVHVLHSDLHIHRLQLDKQPDDRISISHLNIRPDDWEKAIRELTVQLPDTDYKPDYISKLASLCHDSATLSEAFARIMAWLLGSEGLVLVDSADPSVRMLESPMWKQFIARNEELQQAYESGKLDLEASGYAAQAEVHADGANLFYYHQGSRLLLYRKGDGYADRQEQVRLTREQLFDIADREPHRLSNNVLTRPLMQDYLFPVLAVVLGPGEIAYWGQIKEAFACLDMQMPIIVPRDGYTLLEPADQKTLARYGLSIEEALYEWRDKRDQWLRSQDTFGGIEEDFVKMEEQIRRMYGELAHKTERISSVMKPLGEANLSRVIDQVRYYRKRVFGEIESRHLVGLRQFDRLGASLMPGGVPQERFYNIFAYLNRYGDGWLKYLVGQHRPDRDAYKHHYVVYL